MVQRIRRTSLEQTRKRINHLRCGNDSEFLGSEFKEYLSSQGVPLKEIRDDTLDLNEKRK